MSVNKVDLIQTIKNFDWNTRVFEEQRSTYTRFGEFKTETGTVVEFEFDKRGFLVFKGFDRYVPLTLTLNLELTVSNAFTIVDNPWTKSISDFPDGEHVVLIYDSKRLETRHEILTIDNNGEYVVIGSQFGFDYGSNMNIVAYLTLPKTI